MVICLFCRSSGPFSTVEHIVPESLGNDELVLRNEICDGCQSYFGTKIERFVLSNTPFAFWRTLLGIRSKSGRLPSVNLSQPSQEKGVIPAIHELHDDGVGFTAHEDGSASIDIDNPQFIREILAGERHAFSFVFTPKVVHMISRFLLKIGIELLAHKNPEWARSRQFDDAREHARFGSGDRLWPLFHSQHSNLKDLRHYERDEQGLFEHVLCYSYQLLETDKYVVFIFDFGTDRWAVSLSHRYPDSDILSAFSGDNMKMIWYPDVM